MSISLFSNSHGIKPDLSIDDIIPEGIAAMDLAAEASTLLVLTSAGQLRLMNTAGDILETNRNFRDASSIAWSAVGNYGAAIVRDDKLVCFNRQLDPVWDVRVTGRINAVAFAPHGGHLAFSTDGGRTHIVSIDKKEIAKIDTHRPMDHLAFLAESPTLIAAAEFGSLAAYDLKGRELWSENVMTNIGDISASGCGRRILLSAFNHGVQMYNRNGKAKGQFMIDGIPSRVSGAQFKTRLAALTLEGRVYWLDFEGTVKWVADVSADPPEHIRIDPLGNFLFLATRSGRLIKLHWT
ncbi:MAG: hypothetical protein R3C20_24200 [Planctomycetaceae bacterium]